MHKLLVGLTITGAILFSTFIKPAQSQIRQDEICSYFSAKTLKILDEWTIVCKKKQDGMLIYRKKKSTQEDIVVVLDFYKRGDAFVTIIDSITEKVAQFDLEGRKFKKWGEPGIEGRKFKKWGEPGRRDVELLNKYRKYVTLLLDLKEKQEVPDF